MYLIGYDIGSSTIKAALVEASTQEVVSIVQYPGNDMDMISRQIGWAEQQPEIWWQNLCIATRMLIDQSGVKAEDIKGIGLAYQMHGLVLVDKEKRVLRPSIIWCDSRAASIGKQAFEDLGPSHCLTNYLNSPGNFTASKLKWVKDNEPELFRKIHKIMLPGDYIAMKLTGEVGTTISGLSEGIFWNFKEKRIADDLLKYFGFNKDMLPEISSTFASMGQVSREAAIQTGLAQGTPVTYRAGDQPNNAVALNVLREGEVAATSGTSGVVYGIVDKPLYDPKSRINAFAHVNYEQNFDRIGILLCINGAGIEYSWIKQQIARSNTSYQDMDRMASTVPVGSEGICVLPFGNGSERLFEDKNLGSHIFNLRFNRHTRAHLFRASLEGVAFAFVHGINLLKQMGLKVDAIRVGNDNMFQSKIFSMTIATLLGNHIEVVDTTGAVGAARAAGVGNKIYASLEEALEGVQPSRLHEPTLNYALCSQAYSYWEASLNKILDQNPENSSRVKLLKNQRDEFQKQLIQKNKRITSQSAQLSINKGSLNRLIHELSDLSDQATNEKLKIRLKKISQELDASFDNEEHWQSFEEHFDLLNDDFISRLTEEFPNLSNSELKMCSFLRLRMRTKEISIKLNLSTRGVETKRYRIRKKLGMKKGESLRDYLANY
ncbi:MAG: carbohydrate kinase [Bacteroidetes bacterium]|nr:MAG: carbohydrate kinase [Bacteroidota bacterium]